MCSDKYCLHFVIKIRFSILFDVFVNTIQNKNQTGNGVVSKIPLQTVDNEKCIEMHFFANKLGQFNNSFDYNAVLFSTNRQFCLEMPFLYCN